MTIDPAALPPPATGGGMSRPNPSPLRLEAGGWVDVPMLVATGIEKTFDRTRALAGAELEVAGGEVHALLGANGAGKSTLSRVISGHIRRDSGEITYKGMVLDARSPREALASGIAMVMQETSLAPDLSVLENIFLPELGQRGRLSYAKLRNRARAVLGQLGQEHTLPLEAEVWRLSAAQRQLVEIAKALALDAELIIFDEPTASLSPGEVERLFDIMSRLREAGHALIFVSHRLEEVFAVTNRVTVMREGRTVATSVPTNTLTQADIIRFMVGQDVAHVLSRHGAASAVQRPVALRVERLAARPVVRDVSFNLHAGEILGLGGLVLLGAGLLGGLVGAGRSETLEAIIGIRPRSGGQVQYEGRDFVPKRAADSVRAGIGFVPEDRRRQSIIPDFSVRENLLLGHLSAHRGFGLDYASRSAAASELLRQLDLPQHRLLDANMLNFSGGMQQKIIIARWLLLGPRVLILDEPTKGVDIGTRTSIYAMLRAVAEGGTAVLVVSSDFEELLGLCERVVVLSDGVSIADMPSAVLDEEKLTLFAAPRSSMERNAQVLRTLTAEHGGAAFWALLDRSRVFCLNAVVAESGADPGFGAGATPEFAATRITHALAACAEGFVAEPDGERTTLIVQVQSHRGHDLGWIGLTLGRNSALPAATAVRNQIRELFAGSV